MRVLIFIPPGNTQEILALFTSVGGLIFLNSTVVFSLIILLLFAYQRKLFPIIVVLFYIMDVFGIIKIKWLIPVLAIYLLSINPKKMIEPIILLLMLINSYYATTIIAFTSLLAWTFLPLVYSSKKNIKKTLAIAPIAVLLLLGVYKNPYIVGQVFMLSMGINNPWFVPLAMISYALSYSPARLTLFLTGLQLQLSNQVLIIFSVFLYEVYFENKSKDSINQSSSGGHLVLFKDLKKRDIFINFIVKSGKVKY